MAQATQTTLGTIKLAGDLAGSNDANTPTLTSTGVTPGSYVFPTIHVDGKGRITSAASGTSEDIASIIPGANKVRKGIAMIGDNIEVTETSTQGYSLFNYGDTLTGSTPSGLDYDPNRPYLVTLESVYGQKTVSIVTEPGGDDIDTIITKFNNQLQWTALSLVNGNLRLVGPSTGSASFLVISNESLFKYITGYINSTSDNGADANTIWVKEASVSDFGVVKIGAGVTVNDGTISVATETFPKATSTELGAVKIGAGLEVASGVVSTDFSTAVLPTASESNLGVVKIGAGINTGGDGTISVTVPTATTSDAGAVKVGANIDVNAGVISIPIASSSVKGVVKAGYGMTIDSNGTLGVDTTILATSTTPGLVKVGTGLVATNGVVSVDTINLPSASKSAKGAVQIGNNIDVNAGVISVPVASSSVVGVSKIDTSKGFFINANNELSMTTASLAASTTNTGLVRIGANLSATNGTISVSPPNATTSSKGVVQIGAGLNVSNGVVSVPDATTTSKGLVQAGANTSITGGVLSVPVATNSVKGVVSITGNGLSIVDGVLSAPNATANSPGVVKAGYGIVNTNGTMSLDTSAYATSSTPGVVKSGEGIINTNGTLSFNLTDSSNWGTASRKGLVQAGTGVTISNGVLSSSLGANVAFKDNLNTFTVYQNQPLIIHTMMATNEHWSVNPERYELTILEINSQDATVINMIFSPQNILLGHPFRILVNQGSTKKAVTVDSYYFSLAAPLVDQGLTNSTVISTVYKSTLLECIYLNTHKAVIVKVTNF